MCPTLCNGLRPARFLYPWDSPGKNTGVCCYALIQAIFLTYISNLGLLTSHAFAARVFPLVPPGKPGRQNNDFQICPHPNAQTCEHIMLLSWQKELCKCDEGYAPWDENIIQRFNLIACIFRSGELFPTSGNQKDDSVRKPRSTVAVFEDKARVPQTKKWRWPLESWKGKEMNSPPLEFPEGNSTLPTLCIHWN